MRIQAIEKQKYVLIRGRKRRVGVSEQLLLKIAPGRVVMNPELREIVHTRCPPGGVSLNLEET